MIGDIETQETENRLTGMYRQLPRVKLLKDPQELLSRIYYRAADGGIFYVSWDGFNGVGDDFKWVEGRGRNGYVLPPFTGFYLYSPTEYAFRSIGEKWIDAVDMLVLKNIATIANTDNSRVIADAVAAGIKKMKPKPKRNGSNQPLGADTGYLQQIKDEARF